MLVFKSANIETKFLPESELPGFARLINNENIEEMEEAAAIRDSKSTPSTSNLNIKKKN